MSSALRQPGKTRKYARPLLFVLFTPLFIYLLLPVRVVSRRVHDINAVIYKDDFYVLTENTIHGLKLPRILMGLHLIGLYWVFDYNRWDNTDSFEIWHFGTETPGKIATHRFHFPRLSVKEGYLSVFVATRNPMDQEEWTIINRRFLKRGKARFTSGTIVRNEDLNPSASLPPIVKSLNFDDLVGTEPPGQNKTTKITAGAQQYSIIVEQGRTKKPFEVAYQTLKVKNPSGKVLEVSDQRNAYTFVSEEQYNSLFSKQ